MNTDPREWVTVVRFMFGIAEDTGPGFSVRNEKREGWNGVEGGECDRWGPASYRGFGDFKTRAVSENLSLGLSSGMCGECPSTTPVGILCCMWLSEDVSAHRSTWAIERLDSYQGDDDFELGTPEVCLEVEGVSAVRTSRETGVAGCLRLVLSRAEQSRAEPQTRPGRDLVGGAYQRGGASTAAARAGPGGASRCRGSKGRCSEAGSAGGRARSGGRGRAAEM